MMIGRFALIISAFLGHASCFERLRIHKSSQAPTHSAKQLIRWSGQTPHDYHPIYRCKSSRSLLNQQITNNIISREHGIISKTALKMSASENTIGESYLQPKYIVLVLSIASISYFASTLPSNVDFNSLLEQSVSHIEGKFIQTLMSLSGCHLY